jgi:hypothetical protein
MQADDTLLSAFATVWGRRPGAPARHESTWQRFAARDCLAPETLQEQQDAYRKIRLAVLCPGVSPARRAVARQTRYNGAASTGASAPMGEWRKHGVAAHEAASEQQFVRDDREGRALCFARPGVEGRAAATLLAHGPHIRISTFEAQDRNETRRCPSARRPCRALRCTLSLCWAVGARPHGPSLCTRRR